MSVTEAVLVDRSEAARQPGSWERVPLFLALGLILLRAVYAPFCDLFPEEAYYWNYAKHLDIGYLDHPPMVAWLIHLGTQLFGDREVGVRLCALLSSLVASFFAFRLTALLYGRRAGWNAVVLLQVLPFFFLIGFMITPDAPLTACWAGALYFLARALLLGQSRAWLGVGVCLGVGMLSKYTIALLGPAALLFLCLDRPSRVWWTRLTPYLSVVIATAIFSPVIIWNATHHWASFAFQSTNRVAEARHFFTHQLAGSILALLTPIGIVLVVQAFRGRAEKQGSTDDAAEAARRLLFLRIFTLVPLAVFVVFSLTHRVKLNWTGPLWLAAIPAMSAVLLHAFDKTSSALYRGWMATLVVMTLVYAGLLQYLAGGLPGVRYSGETELLPVGWSEMGAALAEKKAQMEQTAPKVLIVGLDRNFIASEAAFYQPDKDKAVRETTGSHLFGGRALMYQFWFPAKEQNGASLLLVSFEKEDINRKLIRERCTELGPIEENWLMRNGKKIRRYYTRTAANFQASTKADQRSK